MCDVQELWDRHSLLEREEETEKEEEQVEDPCDHCDPQSFEHSHISDEAHDAQSHSVLSNRE